MDKNKRKSIFLMFSTAILWSTGGMMIKLIDLNPIAISGYRSIFAVLLISFFIKKSAFKFTLNKVLGAISYTFMVILYVWAAKETTAANAILLQYTAPIYVAVLGMWLLKEKAVARDWIVIVFVIFGMTLFFLDDISPGNMKGNILAILSGIAMAFNVIFMRKQKDADPLENVFWGCVLTILATLPFMILNVPDRQSWVGIGLLGIFQLGLPYILFSLAIKHITALESTFLGLIEPLLNPLWVFLTIGELPGPMSILGGIVVLAAVTIGCMKPKKPLAPELFQEHGS
ncbi:MAG: DMT family transporter [Caldicoprobacterales bacterium]|jgi:drug/metabolite transporter (DMT)-like permease|nr:EamA family transporter [Clostridiales bacterium]